MTPTPIDWPRLLQRFPGQTAEERIRRAKDGATFVELARQIGVNANTLKSLFYGRHGSGNHKHIVRPRIRPDYAAIIGELIKSLAEEQGMTEAEYRERIRTPEGAQVFRFCCAWYKVPLFNCQYLAKEGKWES